MVFYYGVGIIKVTKCLNFKIIQLIYGASDCTTCRQILKIIIY
jgi:hypothetical protein